MLDFLLEVCERMFIPEVVGLVPQFVDEIQRQCLFADFDPAYKAADGADNLVVNDQFLGRHAQRRFQVSGAPHDIDTVGSVCEPGDHGAARSMLPEQRNDFGIVHAHPDFLRNFQTRGVNAARNLLRAGSAWPLVLLPSIWGLVYCGWLPVEKEGPRSFLGASYIPPRSEAISAILKWFSQAWRRLAAPARQLRRRGIAVLQEHLDLNFFAGLKNDEFSVA